MNEHFVRLPVGIHLLDLTATQLKVLLAMAAHANWKTGRLRIKHATICFEVTCSRETVSRSIQRLIGYGLVVDLGRTGRSNGYQIVLDWSAGDHIRCDEAVTSDVTASSHLQNKKDLNENDSNNSSLSPSPTEAEFQPETPEQLVQRELGGELIEETPLLPDPRAVTGRSGLTPDQAREKFSTDNYNPKIAQAEADAMHRRLDPLIDATTSVTESTSDNTALVAPARAGQAIIEAKMTALGRARTPRPMEFPPRFEPAVVGYTREMFKSEFSLLDYDETFNGFVAHHSAKGDTSQNWLASFLTYAQRGQSMARDRAKAIAPEKEHPSNRVVSWDGKRKEMWREERKTTGEGYAAWQARKTREGVELP